MTHLCVSYSLLGMGLTLDSVSVSSSAGSLEIVSVVHAARGQEANGPGKKLSLQREPEKAKTIQKRARPARQSRTRDSSRHACVCGVRTTEHAQSTPWHHSSRAHSTPGPRLRCPSTYSCTGDKCGTQPADATPRSQMSRRARGALHTACRRDPPLGLSAPRPSQMHARVLTGSAGCS